MVIEIPFVDFCVPVGTGCRQSGEGGLSTPKSPGLAPADFRPASAASEVGPEMSSAAGR
ncbi:hypothetical protein L842_6094 [Mycobacterium intracellulare MIN_052511_1280]|nr:hypothetical protein L842_6094 [Mycobacterium intracellulare MIN_052511_1280]